MFIIIPIIPFGIPINQAHCPPSCPLTHTLAGRTHTHERWPRPKSIYIYAWLERYLKSLAPKFHSPPFVWPLLLLFLLPPFLLLPKLRFPTFPDDDSDGDGDFSSRHFATLAEVHTHMGGRAGRTNRMHIRRRQDPVPRRRGCPKSSNVAQNAITATVNFGPGQRWSVQSKSFLHRPSPIVLRPALGVQNRGEQRSPVRVFVFCTFAFYEYPCALGAPSHSSGPVFGILLVFSQRAGAEDNGAGGSRCFHFICQARKVLPSTLPRRGNWQPATGNVG